MNRKYQHILSFDTNGTMARAVVSKLKMMLVFTIHAGIYDSCWYLRFMLVFTVHAGIYGSCWYLRFSWYLRSMLVFTVHAGINDPCWYLRSMLVFTVHAGIYTSCYNKCTIMKSEIKKGR